MIKHVFALAAGALLSLNASAAYIQYNLSGPVSGYIVQHDDDKSIAAYNLSVQGEHVNARFSPSGIFDTLTGASSNFADGMGPTNLSVFDNRTDFYLEYLSLDFRVNAAGAYAYSAQYTQRTIPDLPSTVPSFPLSTWFNGSATLGTPSASLVAYLDAQGGYDGIPRIVPTQNVPPQNVPEPASMALLAAGGLGLAAMRRRKQVRKSA